MRRRRQQQLSTLADKAAERKESAAGVTYAVHSEFPGAPSPFTHELAFATKWPDIPVLQRMNETGDIIHGDSYEMPVSDAKLVTMYETMCRLQAMDQIFYDAQRQGRISFYMTNSGEEAAQIGSSAALDNGDVIFSQYREGKARHRRRRLILN
jgi:2-oxoisovalerate dehydrogenase E1 component alpha subunit